MWNKKIGAMVLLIAITLSVFGFAYAHWSDVITIDGTVQMGSMTLAFDPDEILDYVDNEPGLPEPKDVGWAEIYYDPASYVYDVHTEKDGYKTLVFVIHDAYPQYEVDFTTVVLHNIGTIPLHIIDINVWDPTGELNWTWVNPPDTTPATGFFWKDFDGDGVYDADDEEIMNVKIVNFYCIQLEPCESTKGQVDIHFKQPAEECHTYKFAISIEAIQWDKAP